MPELVDTSDLSSDGRGRNTRLKPPRGVFWVNQSIINNVINSL